MWLQIMATIQLSEDVDRNVEIIENSTEATMYTKDTIWRKTAIGHLNICRSINSLVQKRPFAIQLGF